MEENQNYSVEDMLDSLEELLSRLENKECPLEESFQLYKDGIGMVSACRKKLDAVEQQLIILKEGTENGI